MLRSRGAILLVTSTHQDIMTMAVCSIIFYLLALISTRTTDCSQDRNVIEESRSVARDDVRDNDGHSTADTVPVTDYRESREERGDASNRFVDNSKNTQIHADKGTRFIDNSKNSLEMHADDDTLPIGDANEAWNVTDRHAKRSGRLAKWTDRNSEMFQPNKRSSAIERTIRKREVNILKQAETEDEVFFKEMLQRIETFCPGDGFCPPENAPKIDKTKCCLNCRCEKSCKTTGSCCAHIQMSRDDNFLYIPAVNAKCMNPSIFDETKYEFITSCPESSSREEKAKCELSAAEGQNHTVTTAETIPVLDRARHTNYWNIHCAVCNGASLENLTMWIQVSRCHSFYGLDTRECELSIIQPEVPEVELTKCYTDDDKIISTCNVTGEWEVYDPFLRDACHHLHLHIFIDYSTRPRVDSTGEIILVHRFQNVFCAICNGVNKSMIDVACHSDTKYITGFTKLIRHPLPLDKLPGPIRECGPSQKTDPISGKCKEVTCSYPLAWDSYQNECIEMVFFREALYDIPFSIKFTSDTSLTSLSGFRYYLEDKFITISTDLETTICGFETHFKMKKSFADLDEFDKSSGQLSVSAITDAYVIVYIAESNIMATKAEEAKLSYSFYRDAFANFRSGIDAQTASDEIPGAVLLAANDVQDYEQNYISGFSLDNFDPWTLLPYADPRVTNVSMPQSGTTPLRRRKRETNNFWSIYANVYDKVAMIQLQYITGDCNYNNFAVYDQAYGRSFLSCPTFEYNLADHNINRRPDGIELTGRDAKFGFDEFRSVNETHVRICVDSVLNKVKFVVSSSMVMRYSIVNAVMAVAVAIVGIYVMIFIQQ